MPPSDARRRARHVNSSTAVVHKDSSRGRCRRSRNGDHGEGTIIHGQQERHTRQRLPQRTLARARAGRTPKKEGGPCANETDLRRRRYVGRVCEPRLRASRGVESRPRHVGVRRLASAPRSALLPLGSPSTVTGPGGRGPQRAIRGCDRTPPAGIQRSEEGAREALVEAWK